MDAAATLAARLLYASRLAYSITTTGPLASCDDAVGAGFAGPIAATVAGTDAIDACLVARSADGLVVAFRGTLPPDSANHRQTAEDWVNDLEAALVPWPPLGHGLVHHGFAESLENLWPALKAAITAELGRASAPVILVTGHSKGGALAHLGAYRIAREFGRPAGTLVACTFAAPHPGDVDFAAAYAVAVSAITRYEYADDLVPHVPPSLALRSAFGDVPLFASLADDLAYVAPGELRFIDWDGHVVGDSPTLRAERTFHLIKLIGEFGFDRIVMDHSLADGSGYFDAIVGS